MEGITMAYYWDISACDDAGTTDLSFVVKKGKKNFFLAAPVLLYSTIAVASESPGAAGDVAKVAKKASKAQKGLALFRKGSGIAVTAKTCYASMKRYADANKTSNPAIDLTIAGLLIVCGYLIGVLTLRDD